MSDKFFSPHDCPCKGCESPKRTTTCHSTCEAYITWKSNLDEYNANIRKRKAAEDAGYIPTLGKKKRRWR